MQHPLVLRNAACQATIDKYLNQPFSWGENDCFHLVSHCLTGLGQPDILTGIPAYDTYATAQAAAEAAGIHDFNTYLDTFGWERIAPAAALPGDIISIPSDIGPTWPALGLFISADRILAYAGTACARGGLSRLPPEVMADVVAWRVL